MKYIDLDNWKRKEHFMFFYRMDYPQFNICLNLDISGFLKSTKIRNLSFYYAMIHAVTTIVNRTDDFKYRIRDGKVVLHEKIHPSFTDMDKGGHNDLFKLITVEWKDDICEFEKSARQASQDQSDYFGLNKLTGRDDLIYITCIPWISFTHISHTITINKNDSVPKISWGKYFKDGEKVLLPFSVQVNHALMDGSQIGQYVEKLQKHMDEFIE
jgi:chloramphenicol O-acetyltransferase type A